MPQSVKPFIQIALLLFLSREVLAQNLSLGLKLLDSTQQYRVEDSSRALVAELVFPSKSLVGVLAYTHNTSIGKLIYSFEHSISSQNTIGTDTDWFEEDISVFSQSSTKLEKYFAFTLGYETSLSKSLSLKATLFHKYGKLSWSDTKQYDYIDDVYSEFPSTSVRFTQTLDGLSLGLNYKEELAKIPISISLAGQLAKHNSIDEHLVRNFYTLSRDLLYGYLVDISVEMINNEYGALNLSASYEVLSGKSNMDFYTSSHFKYMSLPASFETEQKSIKINYTFNL